MSKSRRKSAEKKNENNTSLLGNLNLSDLLSILGALDLNKLTSAGSNSSDSSKRNGQNSSEASTTSNEVKEDDSKDTQRDEIIKAINTLINADRNLLIQVVVEVFGLNKLANNKK